MQIIVAFVLAILIYRKVMSFMATKSRKNPPKEELEQKNTDKTDQYTEEESFVEILEEEKEMKENKNVVDFNKTINKLKKLREDTNNSMKLAVDKREYDKLEKLIELDRRIVKEIEDRTTPKSNEKGILNRLFFRTGKLAGSLTRGFKEGIVKDTD